MNKPYPATQGFK